MDVSMEERQEIECDHIALANFIKYLQIPTVQPSPNYWEAVNWLLTLAESIGLQCYVNEPVKGKPILVAVWEGKDPNLPGILCNSHMDVVPIYPDKWHYPPFGAEIHNGLIYARGSQDMKCVGIQQIEAIRRLKARGYNQLDRTIYLCFVPDEEIGSSDGMEKFVMDAPHYDPKCKNDISFHDLNIGLCLDEGLACPKDHYIAFYEERSPWWFDVTVSGNGGHGSSFIKNCAIERFNKLVSKLLEYRKNQEDILSSNPTLDLGDVTSINLTRIAGGVQPNVVPSDLTLTVDMRITPSEDFEELETRLRDWFKSIDPDYKLNFIVKNSCTNGIGKMNVSRPDASSNCSWRALHSTCARHGVGVKARIFQGATDARFIRRYHRLETTPDHKRNRPIPAINFSPMHKTKVLLHDHDEYLGVDEFMKGCRVYADLLLALSELDEFT